MHRLDYRNLLGIKIIVAAVLGGVLAFFAMRQMGASPASVAPVASVTRPRVDVVYPQRATVARRLQTNATLEAYEDADLFAKVSGYLSEVRVDIGDHIKAGQILAVIDVPELDAELNAAKARFKESEAQVLVKHAQLEFAMTTYQRWKNSPKGVVSEQDREDKKAQNAVAAAELTAAQAKLGLDQAEVDRLTALEGFKEVTAPFDGIVAQRLVNRGDLVQAPTASRTTPLFEVQRIDTIRVFCDVPEAEAPHVRAGDLAIVKPFGLDGAQFTGTVARLALRLDPETRNMRTEIDLPNPGERLYPGMYAEVSLQMDRRHNVLALPASAIGADGNGTFVYTVRDGRIERLPIQTGISDNNLIEVAEGLSEKAAVVMTVEGAPPSGTPVQSLPFRADTLAR